ncbi:MORC family CW-type zinc finger protein 3-like isoform X1 [Myxocyprinus asiaticus]|uniref:MORC family CW-type zinc finger protein 3-like isoform X1 n=1 Tax=Myxocyprinus asiaticus TaxID=70543 RepID=UPI00222249D3|nr:MORC family CW-type zinc finger protein 3-like isoform X1 [Myxocyprinus asiaticus]
MAVQMQSGIPLSALNPKYLHTNSTSHTWPFSAIAELIDNAYDPDVNAKKFWIDKTVIRGQDCLTFMDNGAGLDYDKMYKMLSFGFSDKKAKNGHVPVGLYGNGFKSGSMRLGKDAIVLSKKEESMCVGLLSQTYLHKIQAENVIVPIVSFKHIGQSFRPESQHAASLQDILRYSLFQTEAELLSELNAINAHYSSGSTGTRIIIWNLRKALTDKSEFDFEVDRYDIRIPADVYESEKQTYKQSCHTLQSSPESDFSLRAYCSILYLKPRMQIIIRGQKVKTQLISKSLAHVMKDKYKPKFLNKESILITFGYNTKSKEHYGVMMYHKNRLIKAYERVGCQHRANNKGVGVIAVIECNFLKPTHNKRDFDNTEEYRKTMQTLGVKLEDYWNAVRHKKGFNSTVPVEDIPKRPDQNWVQCDDCLKWRKLPDGIDTSKLPEKWFCRLNPDPQYRQCETPEEAEDSEDESSAYLKTYKQHERSLKKQQEQKRMQMEETMLRQKQQRNEALTQENQVLRKQQEDLVRQLQQSAPSSPIADENPVSSRPLPQSASSTLDSMPVISNVVSLSTPKRTKRSLVLNHNQAVKRARTSNGYYSNTPDSPSTSTAASGALNSMMGIPDNNGHVNEKDVEDNDDDDIVIDETNSTPRPPTFDLAKVKSEGRKIDGVLGLYMECSDQASIETPATEGTKKATMDTSTSNGQASITTQTECSVIVKEEEELQRRKGEGEIRGEETENNATRMEQSPTEVECRKDEDTDLDELIRDSMDIERCPSADRQSRPKSALEDKEDSSLFSGIDINNISTLEAQKQQDNLLDLLETTAQERDAFKGHTQFLTLQLEQKESKLLELTVKKENAHQSTQTDQLEERDYKTLFLKTTEQVEVLRRERDELKQKEEQLLQMKSEKVAADHAFCGSIKSQGEGQSHGVDDEMALQVDFLLRELDQRNTECDELKSKLNNLEQERVCCEQLQKEIEELRREREAWRNRKVENGSCSSEQAASYQNRITESKETEEIPVGGENMVTLLKLRELRFSVARLLVTFVPALDPEQVNYDCDVIDEILNQVIEDISPHKSTST